MTAFWCATALLGGRATASVRITADADGRIDDVLVGAAAEAGDIHLGTVMPGAVNAHSHAFHRVLRGRTHGDGGDFWQWRKRMYAAAAVLDPDLYRELATAVFAEMLVGGWTSVGEFHYLHHRSDGGRYADRDMERALVDAATSVGIRLTLLDTCYLSGGIGQPLSQAQKRFGDGSAERWLERWHELADIAAPGVTIGAALHSVRGVPRTAIATVVRDLPTETPLHIHLSEQPRENEECVREYGLTPTGLLHSLGVLASRLSVVHATHLTDDDIRLLGDAGVTAVICPSTEADLGDGIGPARRLADAGVLLALGSDQNAVIDPFLEARALEAGERLMSGERGRFSPTALWGFMGANGAVSLGQGRGGIAVGSWCDLVELDPSSRRTAGSDAGQLVLSATADDVQRVFVGGILRVSNGVIDGTNPAELLTAALANLDERLAR